MSVRFIDVREVTQPIASPIRNAVRLRFTDCAMME
jgi:hypothetical protein